METDRQLNVLRTLPPPFEWCEIPAGRVTLTAGGYIPAGGKTFTVEPFAIAKYPITNAQYQIFVQAEDGYRDAKWWDYAAGALKWRAANPNPTETGFAGDDSPRTNVSWHEALAFCRWLSARTGLDICLPTELQWQRAAQGNDGRIYPWGNIVDINRCNSWDSGHKKPTPVTAYANGKSPFNVFDMSGNVLEWCLTRWKQGDTNLLRESHRVVRGGSFRFSASHNRVDVRACDHPRARYDSLGFRPVTLL